MFYRFEQYAIKEPLESNLALKKNANFNLLKLGRMDWEMIMLKGWIEYDKWYY